MKILLTGATGYIGKRLVPQLVEDGHEIVCAVRDKSRFIVSYPNVSVIEIDLLKKETLHKIPQDIDGAYYLVHSMSTTGSDFDTKEAQCARNFNMAIKKTTVKHVIYLSGIVNHHTLSKHLQSRKTVEDIFSLSEPYEIIGIDEAQFFDNEIIEIAQTLADSGKRVIIAGLDTDFRGEPFGPIPVLMAQAERVDKLHAICMICGEPASRTQRLIDGEPARYDEPVVVVGAAELYEARCRRHHDVPKG